MQSSAPGDITPKLKSLTAQLGTFQPSVPTEPTTTSQLAVQAASIASYVANQGMNVGPGALGGDVQSALKEFLEVIGRCVPGADKETSRTMSVPVQVFLKNNLGGALAVLSEADRNPVAVEATVDGLGIGSSLGGASVSVEL
ncbi:hypothetical protein RSOLAG22IIIB_10316 [Rhizoctonia solani]|uniref:Uncharacterized protein n=1 Tax=Rhizoctonia solani TaxID=456999 RepID=A0A0K6G372_9AGAM|nr:hypothetical protein RSOLAG22IIIB_10316 [Rhizoctonia solani]